MFTLKNLELIVRIIVITIFVLLFNQVPSVFAVPATLCVLPFASVRQNPVDFKFLAETQINREIYLEKKCCNYADSLPVELNAEYNEIKNPMEPDNEALEVFEGDSSQVIAKAYKVYAIRRDLNTYKVFVVAAIPTGYIYKYIGILTNKNPTYEGHFEFEPDYEDIYLSSIDYMSDPDIDSTFNMLVLTIHSNENINFICEGQVSTSL